MKLTRFNNLVRAAGFGVRKGGDTRTIEAARLHLVDGLSVEEARKKVGGISKQSIYALVRRLPTETCEACGQPLPQDRASQAPARARRSAKA